MLLMVHVRDLKAVMRMQFPVLYGDDTSVKPRKKKKKSMAHVLSQNDIVTRKSYQTGLKMTQNTFWHFCTGH